MLAFFVLVGTLFYYKTAIKKSLGELFMQTVLEEKGSEYWNGIQKSLGSLFVFSKLHS